MVSFCSFWSLDCSLSSWILTLFEVKCLVCIIFWVVEVIEFIKGLCVMIFDFKV